MTQEIVARPDAGAIIAAAMAQLPAETAAPEYDPGVLFRAIMGNEDLPKPEGAGSIDPIIARILSAPDVESAIRQTETTGMDALLGRALELENPRWFPSDFKEGARCFVVCDAVELESGIVNTVTIGSVQPQVVIWRAWLEGKLPLKCRFAQSAKPSASGYFPFSIISL